MKPHTTHFDDCGCKSADYELKIAKMVELFYNVMEDHADDASGFYNECDQHPCQWCAEAKEAMK